MPCLAAGGAPSTGCLSDLHAATSESRVPSRRLQVLRQMRLRCARVASTVHYTRIVSVYGAANCTMRTTLHAHELLNGRVLLHWCALSIRARTWLRSSCTMPHKYYALSAFGRLRAAASVRRRVLRVRGRGTSNQLDSRANGAVPAEALPAHVSTLIFADAGASIVRAAALTTVRASASDSSSFGARALTPAPSDAQFQMSSQLSLGGCHVDVPERALERSPLLAEARAAHGAQGPCRVQLPCERGTWDIWLDKSFPDNADDLPGLLAVVKVRTPFARVSPFSARARRAAPSRPDMSKIPTSMLNTFCAVSAAGSAARGGDRACGQFSRPGSAVELGRAIRQACSQGRHRLHRLDSGTA